MAFGSSTMYNETLYVRTVISFSTSPENVFLPALSTIALLENKILSR